MIDKDRLIFGSKMVGIVVDEFNANCDMEEAQEFVSYVYDQYKLNGSPKNVKNWLKQFLGNYYGYVTDPPNWVEDEPNWPYLNGKPMIFIAQFEIPETETTKEKLTWGNVIYLFGQRVPYKTGFKVEYRVVEQFIGIDGTGNR